MFGNFKILLLVVLLGLLNSGMVFASGFVSDSELLISYVPGAYRVQQTQSVKSNLKKSKSEIAGWQFYVNIHNDSSNSNLSIICNYKHINK